MKLKLKAFNGDEVGVPTTTKERSNIAFTQFGAVFFSCCALPIGKTRFTHGAEPISVLDCKIREQSVLFALSADFLPPHPRSGAFLSITGAIVTPTRFAVAARTPFVDTEIRKQPGLFAPLADFHLHGYTSMRTTSPQGGTTSVVINHRTGYGGGVDGNGP